LLPIHRTHNLLMPYDLIQRARLQYSFYFFFSSRRRHTRSTRDWSSDVCSSDLAGTPCSAATASIISPYGTAAGVNVGGVATGGRSEERRVGKECRSRGGGYH